MTTALRVDFASKFNLVVVTTITDAANMLMDADGEEVAVKYYPLTTSPITHVDMYFNISGTVSDTNFDFRIESDSSGVPSASVLGAACTKFAGPAADGWTGAQALATNSGALTIGTPVWIICRRVDGGSLSGTDKVQFSRVANNPGNVVMRHYNGADWTTTTATSTLPLCIVTHADGSFGAGFPQTGSAASSGYTDIYNSGGTNRQQAIKIKFGSKVVCSDVSVTAVSTGTPDSLLLDIYEGSTHKYGPYTLTLTSGISTLHYLSELVTLNNDVDVYFVFSQAAGDDSNDWDLQCIPITAAYISACLEPDHRFCYGTGTDPTAFTEVTDRCPAGFILGLYNFETGLDVPAASGGASPVMGGMVTSQMLGGF